GFGGEEHDGSVIDELHLVAQVLLELPFPLFRYQVPLVDANNNGSAALVRVSGDGGIERKHAFDRIEHHQNHVGHADVAASHDYAQLLRHESGLALAADSGRIDKNVFNIVVDDCL